MSSEEHRGVTRRLAAFLTGGRAAAYYLALSAAIVLGLVVPKYVHRWDGPFDGAGTLIGADFMAFYTGGHFLRVGRADELYDLHAQVGFQDELLGPKFKGGYLYINPPPYAVLMMPLARLPHLAAVFIWWGLGLTLMVLAAWWARREYDPSTVRLGIMVGASLGFFPALLNFMMGQNSFFSLAIFTGAFVLLRRRRDMPAGLLLGVLILKPQLLLGWGVLLLAAGRARALLGIVATTLLLVLLSLVVAPAAWPAFLEIAPNLSPLIRNTLDHGGPWLFPTYLSVSLPAAVGLLLDEVAPRVGALLGWAATLATLGAVVLLWRRLPWEPGTRTWDMGMATTVVATLLASPHLMAYDLTMLLLPAWIVFFRLGFSWEKPLDEGPMLLWMAATTLGVFVGVALVAKTLFVWLPTVGLPRVIPQLATIPLVGWGLHLRACTLRGAGSPEAATGRG